MQTFETNMCAHILLSLQKPFNCLRLWPKSNALHLATLYLQSDRHLDIFVLYLVHTLPHAHEQISVAIIIEAAAANRFRMKRNCL